MQRMRRFAAAAAAIAMLTGCAAINGYQRSGQLRLAGLSAPVEVVRDEKGMAFIHAATLDDAVLAQGFVTAQDRLFQMALTRLFASGRICELAGDQALKLDRRMRTLGFRRRAERHAALLSGEDRRLLARYVAGVNAYIHDRTDTHPIEFTLAGIRPEPWDVADALAVMYYMGWSSAANLKTEVIAQLLVDKLGLARASTLFPLVVNPDDPRKQVFRLPPTERICRLGADGGDILEALPVVASMAGSLAVGSNNWVAAPQRSASGKAVVANDPHLDVRRLPGPWYPVGLITPQVRAVGVTIPGTPGMIVGRTGRTAFGVTNAYGDAQDLYVEKLDPRLDGNYLEGDRSIPFKVRTETLRIKDRRAEGGYRHETLTVRETRRGPVISDVIAPLQAGGRRVVSVRWSPWETMGPGVGIHGLLTATTAADLRKALQDVNWIMLNIVFADVDGNIGWQTTGKLPIRAEGSGLVPLAVIDDQDNWTGWIPFDQMPQAFNPPRQWLGTCNHATAPADYPYVYSTHQATSCRYRRLKQLMAAPERLTVDDHWRFQIDTQNLMAAAIAPIMARALSAEADCADLGRLLADWDHRDTADQAGPTVFQAVYRQFALEVFQDELGDRLAEAMLRNWYFWQERLQRQVAAGTWEWFDDIRTASVRESRDALFVRAARKVRAELAQRLGDDPDRWRWGRVHRLDLVSPIARSGWLKPLLGGGSHAAAGSGETLYRNVYAFEHPFDATVSDSLRMVADLGDPDKIRAVLPGGVSGRVFYPHTQDQIAAYFDHRPVFWWFSDAAIRSHAHHRLILAP